MAKLNLKERIGELDDAVANGTMSAGFALARLALDFKEGAFAPQTAPTVARVSFRKNVEIAPFKHEHAEVTVECNGASLAEAAQVAKDAVDEVLGVKELKTAQEQIENAKKVLKNAALARKKRGSKAFDQALEDALTWGNDDDFS